MLHITPRSSPHHSHHTHHTLLYTHIISPLHPDRIRSCRHSLPTIQPTEETYDWIHSDLTCLNVWLCSEKIFMVATGWPKPFRKSWRKEASRNLLLPPPPPPPTHFSSSTVILGQENQPFSRVSSTKNFVAPRVAPGKRFRVGCSRITFVASRTTAR